MRWLNSVGRFLTGNKYRSVVLRFDRNTGEENTVNSSFKQSKNVERSFVLCRIDCCYKCFHDKRRCVNYLLLETSFVLMLQDCVTILKKFVHVAERIHYLFMLNSLLFFIQFCFYLWVVFCRWNEASVFIAMITQWTANWYQMLYVRSRSKNDENNRLCNIYCITYLLLKRN